MKGILLFCFLLFSTPNFSKDNNNSLQNEQKLAWFKEAKFGMFVHWGLYSLLEGSYNGHTLPDTTLANGRSWYAEWIQMRLEVPSSDYKSLINEFNPIHFDADEWIKEAKNAGMHYFVITSKHHDGFAMWDSKVSEFNIMHTPFGRDIIKELVSACKKQGLKYGFYYSHWHDWEYPGGALPYWFDKVEDEKFEKYWQEKSLPQIKELITLYDPDLLWFDTWDEVSHITEKRRDELIDLVRNLSPKCLINGRISYYNPGDDIDFLEMHDNQYPDKILNKPWQTPATMIHSWGWHAKDFNWKSSDRMIEYLINNTSKGGNYLLNVGPKADGKFPVPATRRLREMGAWLLVNGDAVYNTYPVSMETPEKVYLSQKTIDGNHYLYISIALPLETIILPLPESNAIYECEVLESGRPISYKQSSEDVKIDIPSNLYKDSSVQVIRLRISKPI
ncbi:alpha-L-fucosidase [Bacteroidales bacterium OttesenSCG-928-M11]|nr:alpha-L-fucosidase [Bacteroidales bacterium OttesenSCG-928-M11]